MVRKSTPEQVETVVVGSGFGGSVTAFRLAEAGRDVLVLERGRAYPPGSFPRSPGQLARTFWDPDAGRHGLFDVWSLGGVDAVVSAGLGGGSLIFANALERADERWFVRSAAARGRPSAARDPRTDAGAGRRRPAGRAWPISRADLEPHYDAVERMLGATPFPAGRPGYDSAGRSGSLRSAAERAGLDWRAPALAVSFASRGITAPGLALPEAAYGNVHGRARTTCQLTGDCVLGCNHGAKNSLDHTYLSAAAYHGAEIRTRCEVRGVAPDGEGGWVVSYVEHHRATDGVPADTVALPMRAVRCARVVLAAGALGSTYLLLRARPRLPAISPLLGHGFSGNGDALGLVSGAQGADRPSWSAGSAPTITGAAWVPDAFDGGDGPGFVVHDAGVPAFVSWLLAGRQLADPDAGLPGGGLLPRLPGLPAGLGLPGVGRPLRLARDARDWLAARLPGGSGTDLGGWLRHWTRVGAGADAMVALLAVGRDGTDGVLTLNGDRLGVERAGGRDDHYLDRVRATMAELAAGLGGRLAPDAFAAPDQRATAHPLGGAPMGSGPRDGVVDECGQAFGHPGLYVVDGAAIPGPIGAAPALTIAAFADRAAQRMVADGRRRASLVPRPRTSPSARALAAPTPSKRATSNAATTTASKSAPSTTDAKTPPATTKSTASGTPGVTASRARPAKAGPAKAAHAEVPVSKAGAVRATVPTTKATATKATATKATATKATATKATATKATTTKSAAAKAGETKAKTTRTRAARTSAATRGAATRSNAPKATAATRTPAVSGTSNAGGGVAPAGATTRTTRAGGRTTTASPGQAGAKATGGALPAASAVSETTGRVPEGRVAGVGFAPSTGPTAGSLAALDLPVEG